MLRWYSVDHPGRHLLPIHRQPGEEGPPPITQSPKRIGLITNQGVERCSLNSLDSRRKDDAYHSPDRQQHSPLPEHKRQVTYYVSNRGQPTRPGNGSAVAYKQLEHQSGRTRLLRWTCTSKATFAGLIDASGNWGNLGDHGNLSCRTAQGPDAYTSDDTRRSTMWHSRDVRLDSRLSAKCEHNVQ